MLHELLTTWRVLRRMPVMTARRHRGIPRPIGVLSEIKAMALLVIRPRVTLRLPKAAAMRCDEGFNAYDLIENSVYLDFEQYA
jgi:hypothetical protein